MVPPILHLTFLVFLKISTTIEPRRILWKSVIVVFVTPWLSQHDMLCCFYWVCRISTVLRQKGVFHTLCSHTQLFFSVWSNTIWYFKELPHWLLVCFYIVWHPLYPAYPGYLFFVVQHISAPYDSYLPLDRLCLQLYWDYPHLPTLNFLPNCMESCWYLSYLEWWERTPCQVLGQYGHQYHKQWNICIWSTCLWIYSVDVNHSSKYSGNSVPASFCIVVRYFLVTQTRVW
jgi:hypothetical protein